MKTLIPILLITLVLCEIHIINEVPERGLASTESVQCEIESEHGFFSGQGSTKIEAKKKARMQCTDLLMDKLLSKKSQLSDDEVGFIVDSCVNLECVR